MDIPVTNTINKKANLKRKKAIVVQNKCTSFNSTFMMPWGVSAGALQR